MLVRDIASQIMEAQRAAGYTVKSSWGRYRDIYLPVIVYFENLGVYEWNSETADQYRKKIQEKATTDIYSHGWSRRLMTGIDDLEYFYKTGKLRWPFLNARQLIALNPYYQSIKDAYLKSEPFHPNTLGDITWICDKYFSWLQSEKITTLQDATAEVIQEFIRVCSLTMAESSLYDVRLYMKKLYRFLYENGYINNSYDLLFSFRVSRNRPQQPAADPEEVKATLSVIDRHTVQGKRDYAMILLGAVYGMRSSDIIHLKLENIDWSKGEIHVWQSKTEKLLVLPLTNEVGKALKDYILNGRPKCEYKEIFIRLHAPHQPYVDGSAIQYLYGEYRRKAGLTRSPFDGKGFHSLRRNIGKTMITSGVPVTTVAQVLGHSNVTSVQKYVALDSVHLKECALDFTGIEVKKNEKQLTGI